MWFIYFFGLKHAKRTFVFRLWKDLSSSQEVAYQSPSEAPLIYLIGIWKMTFQKGVKSWRSTGDYVKHWLISHLQAGCRNISCSAKSPASCFVRAVLLHILTFVTWVMLRVCRLLPVAFGFTWANTRLKFFLASLVAVQRSVITVTGEAAEAQACYLPSTFTSLEESHFYEPVTRAWIEALTV